MTQQAHHRIDALAKGTLLHAYRIKEELGSGAFGITYLAEHGLLNTLHVIKEYLPESALRDHATSTVAPKSHQEEDLFNWGMTSFFNEARMLNQLSHPNIVKVSDLFEANGTAYFVMPYLKGITLHQWIKAHPKPSQQQLDEVFIPILEGLKYIHERNLLHRDIKPENIYITDNGNPVLIDFGAARLAIGNKSKALTQVLTPHFAPWEQYRSKGDFTPALDLYSLAGCLYQAITQKLPEEAPNRLEDDPQPKLTGSEHEALYAPHFLQAIDTALNVWAKDRYQNAFEFQRALLGQSQSAAVASGSATNKASGETHGGSTAPEPSPVSPDPSSSVAKTSSKKGLVILASLVAITAVAAGGYFLSQSPDRPGPDLEITQERTEPQQSEAEAELQAQAAAEAERLAAEQAEAERAEAERLEAERLAAEQAEAEKLEAERLEAERIAKQQREAEEAARLARQQRAAEQADNAQWQAARESNTLAAYQAYLADCSLCSERTEAQMRIQDLRIAQEAEQSRLAAEQAAREEETRQAELAADNALWQTVQASQTIAAFQGYLNGCLRCQNKSDAENAIAELQTAQREADAQLYSEALAENSLAGWQGYLADCRQCEAESEVRQRILDIETALAAQSPDDRLWEQAQTSDTSISYAAYLENCDTCGYQQQAEQLYAQTQGLEQGLRVSLSAENGEFSSIQAAIEFAREGTTIEIEAGEYEEAIQLSKAVVLRAAANAEVIISASDRSALQVSGGGEVHNLTLRNTAMLGTPPAVLIEGSSSVLLQNLIIESGAGAAVRVQNTASPRISDSQLRSQISSALIVTQQAAGAYNNNRFYQSGEYGIRIDSRGEPEFSNNRVELNERGGIALANNTRGIFTSNYIAENLSTGVLVSYSANPQFVNNTIENNEQYGLQIFEQGRGTFEANTITGHSLVGVLVRNGGAPIFNQNQILANQDGVQFVSGAGGTFTDNQVRENTQVAITIRGNSNPEFNTNVIDSNRSGIYILDSGKGRFRDNQITNHSGFGVSVASGGEPEFRNNQINGNTVGVQVVDGGAGRFVENDVNKNTENNWQVDESSSPVID